MLGFGVFESGLVLVFVKTLNTHIVLFALEKILPTLLFCLPYNVIIGILSFFQLFGRVGIVA